MTALSMISFSFKLTLFHSSGMWSLTQNKPGMDDLLKYGSTYVELLKNAMIFEPKVLPVLLSLIFTGSSYSALWHGVVHDLNTDTPSILSLSMTPM